MEETFLSTLQANRKTQRELNEFRESEISEYRIFDSCDSYKSGVDCIYFETRGKGKREILQAIHRCKGDTGRIGAYWGEIYLKGDGLNFPRKFAVKSCRIMIHK